MSQADVFHVIQTVLVLALELSAPMLVFAVVVGILTGLFQAVTQLNDSTLSIVPKILAVFVALAIFGPWMFHSLSDFTTRMLSYVPGAGV
jgi:flagellar biosynthetic protein FliQ